MRGKREKKRGKRFRAEPLKPEPVGNKVARGIFRAAGERRRCARRAVEHILTIAPWVDRTKRVVLYSISLGVQRHCSSHRTLRSVGEMDKGTYILRYVPEYLTSPLTGAREGLTKVIRPPDCV